MSDQANLVLGVDSTQVKAAGQSLDDLVDAGKRAEGATGKLASATDILAGVYRKLIGAAAVWKAYDMVRDAAMLAARYQELGVVMTVVGKNAGYNAQEMQRYATETQKMGITMLESRNTVVQLAQAQVDLSQASKLARIAQDAAVVGNTNSSDALQRMIHGIKTAQIDVLRTIGINVNFEASYKALAKELGVSTTALTETQKMTARQNAVMLEGTKLAGAYEAAMGTAGKQLRSMARYTEDLSLMMGEMFTEVMTVAVMGLTAGLKDANGEVTTLSQNNSLRSWGEGLVDTFAFVADSVATATATFRFAGEAIGGVMARWSIMPKNAGEWAEMAFDAKKGEAYKAQVEAINSAQTEAQAAILASTSAMRDAVAKRRAAHSEGAAKIANNEKSYLAAQLVVQKAYAGESLKVQQAAQAALKTGFFGADPLKPISPVTTDTTGSAAAKSAARAYESAVKSAKDYIQSLKDERQEVGTTTEQQQMLDSARKAALAPTAALRREIMEQALALRIAINAEEDMTNARKGASEAVEKALAWNKQITQSYRDANIAAAAYIATISKQAQREVGGLGKGNAFRAHGAGLNAIEDKLTGQRQNLEGDKRRGDISPDQFEAYLAIAESTYRQEVGIYESTRTSILAAQGSWQLGAAEGLANYASEAGNVYQAMEGAAGKAFKGMEEALTNFVMTGKLDFASLANSIISDLIRIAIQQSIMKPLASMMGFSLFSANGNSFDSGGVTPFANGGAFHNSVLTEPTPFFFAKGAGFAAGVAGEDGEEAVMPLKRGSDGKLGVVASGGGSRVTNINITVNATVGDVASKSDVIAGMRTTAQQIAAQIQRSRSHGGELA